MSFSSQVGLREWRITRVRKTFLPKEMTTQGSISQPVLVTVGRGKPTRVMAAANAHTVTKFRQIFCAVDLQHDDAQNVVLWVEKVFTTASFPGLSKSAFLLFGVLGGRFL